MKNIFGTDGIRGLYPSEINDSIAYVLGASLCEANGMVVVGQDTRLSGNKLLSALCQGIYDKGGSVVNIGILPTNAVSFFTRKLGADYGVMITASHNPPAYNGLKVFDQYGVKLCEQKQMELSEKIHAQKTYYGRQLVYEKPFEAAQKLYADSLLEFAEADLSGLSLAIDCAYGSAYKVSKEVFEKTGATVKWFNNFARGELINTSCGATYPEFLKEKITTQQLGFCIDGDADRLVTIEKGEILSGDRIFYALAKYFAEKDMLSSSAVVGTVLSNGGLERALNGLGISLLRSDVGDFKMFRLMSMRGVNLAGEESGHYILSNYATGSDSLLNALFISKIHKEKGSIANYTQELALSPVFTDNILLSREQISQIVEKCILDAIADEFREKFPSCRLVLRPSGTEPKIRIYVEGEEKKGREALDFVVAKIAAES